MRRPIRRASRRGFLLGAAALGMAASTECPEAAELVARRPVQERGLVGTLFTPAKKRPYAAVLCLAGVGVAIPETPAKGLALEGFSALALATSSAPGLPETMRNIPLEYCSRALDWLLATVQPPQGRMVVRGHSRGAELALILGAMFPSVSAVLAYSPRTYVGLATPDQDKFDDPATPPAFTWQGKPVRFDPLPSAMMADPSKPTLEDRFGIPVERTRGPIIFVTGTSDHWISQDPTRGCQRAMRRLDLFHFRYRHEHWIYPDAGHMIADPPPLQTGLDYGGGSEAGTGYAVSDSWKRSVTFLKSLV